MYKAALSRLTHSLVVAAAAVSSACANDAPLGLSGGAAPGARLAASAEATAGTAKRGPDLTGCEHLRAPERSKRVAHMYAKGVQIYRWSGTAWLFAGPSAVLYSDAAGRDQVGTHYVGPTWESSDGSTVRGSSPVPCTVDPNAIPWLLLVGTPGETSGIFRRATSIQRVNTVGGTIPAEPGTTPGEERHVPYTAEYYFYRAR
jgi:hypothetical protein